MAWPPVTHQDVQDQITNLPVTYSKKRSSRVALFGDSILHLDTPYTAASETIVTSYWSGAMVMHANTLLGQRFNVVDDFAVPGDTTTQMVARLSAVLASTAETIIFMGGTNDLFATTPAATTIANYQAIHDAVLGAGKTLVHCTILPSTAYTSTAQQGIRATLNRWILQQGDTRPGVVVVPWDDDITDPVTGYPIAGQSNDGTHPQMIAGLALGKALAATLTNLFPDKGNGWLPASNADPFNALPNGMMLGSNTQTGTNVSGVAPDYRTLYGNAYTAISGAKAARTDGKGEWWDVSYTGLQAPSGNDDTANAGIYTGLAAGFLGPSGYVAQSTKTFGFLELSTTNFANATNFYLQVIYISGGNFVWQTYTYRVNNFTTDNTWQDFSGVIRTPTITTPAGTDTVVFNVQASAKNGQTVTVRIGRTAVYFV